MWTPAVICRNGGQLPVLVRVGEGRLVHVCKIPGLPTLPAVARGDVHGHRGGWFAGLQAHQLPDHADQSVTQELKRGSLTSLLLRRVPQEDRNSPDLMFSTQVNEASQNAAARVFLLQLDRVL